NRETKAFLHGLLDKLYDSKQYFWLQMHVLRLKGAHEGNIAAISGISRQGDHGDLHLGAERKRTKCGSQDGRIHTFPG
ncbi:hypothetical protein ACCT02_38025, partial [Rhizobium ruizarguesonis]